MKSEKIKKAAKFAAYHFRLNNIRRKYTNTPYIQHPAAVADLVAMVTDDEDMICAAWLHDCVEDCKTVTLADIEREFGPRVAMLVENMTDVSKPEDGNRAQRKAIDLQHTAKSCPDGKTIKLADLIHNTADIMCHDPKFAETYLAEKKLLLEVLTEGNQRLWNMARDQVYCSASVLKNRREAVDLYSKKGKV